MDRPTPRLVVLHNSESQLTTDIPSVTRQTLDGENGETRSLSYQSVLGLLKNGGALAVGFPGMRTAIGRKQDSAALQTWLGP